MNIARIPLSIVARLFPDAIFYHPTREKIITLTIDGSVNPSELVGTTLTE